MRLTTSGVLDTTFGGGDGIVEPAEFKSFTGLQILSGDKLLILANSSTDTEVLRFNANGTPDNTWSGDSQAPVTFANTATGVDLRVDASGRVLVAATVSTNFNDFGLARLTTAGALDTSFDSDGLQTITFYGPQRDRVDTVLLQSDGKIITVGMQIDSTEPYGQVASLELTRFLTNGQLDPAFGTGGRVSLPQTSSPRRRGAVLQADGKILVAENANGTIGVWRFNTNGTLDTSFSGDGLAEITSFGETDGIVVQADGKIVVAVDAGGSLELVRFTSNGAADTSYGGDGTVETSIGGDFFGSYSPIWLAIDSNDRLLAAASAYLSSLNKVATRVARFSTSGALDTSFSYDGVQDVDLGTGIQGYAAAIAMYPNGKIVVGMNATPPFDVEYYTNAVGLARLNVDGSFDTSFDGDGKIVSGFNGTGLPGYRSSVSDVAVDSSNRLLVTGVYDGYPYLDHFVVQRRLVSGALDTTFNRTGTLTVQADAVGKAIAVSSKAIAVAGEYSGDVVVARLLVTPDPGPFAVVALSANNYTISEGAGTLTITAKRTGDTTVAAAANWSISGGMTATIGTDLPFQSGTINFSAGQTSKTFTIHITSDTLDEYDEQFRLSLNYATGTTQIGNPQTALATITDDDAAPKISVNDVSITEGNSGTKDLTFTISLSAASGKWITVKYATTGDTAKAPGDFTALPLTQIHFAQGETTKQVTVKIKGDTVHEAAEKFFLDLSSPNTNATILKGRGIGTINDNDPAGIDAFFAAWGVESLRPKILRGSKKA